MPPVTTRVVDDTAPDVSVGQSPRYRGAPAEMLGAGPTESSLTLRLVRLGLLTLFSPGLRSCFVNSLAS
jgi:hypothetical protein